MKLHTLETFRAAALAVHCYQRGPDHLAGYSRDADWRRAVRRARTWDAMAYAVRNLPGDWPAIAANGGRRP